MNYMLLIHDQESLLQKMPPAEMQALLAEYRAFTEELKKAGIHRSSSQLRPVSMATTVRVRSGKTTTTDGPFAETKEQLGGYYLIDVPDLDEALRWAAKVPSARIGSIEVRPLWE